MTKSEEKSLEERLDNTAVQLRMIQDESNSARAETLRNELGLLVYSRFFRESFGYDEQDIFQEAFFNAYETFTPEKGSFSRYFSFLLGKRMKDLFRKRRLESLDAPINSADEDSGTIGEQIADETTPAPDSRVLFEARCMENTAMILNFTKLHPGRQGNEKRRCWYRIFFTENMTLIYKELDVHFDHERDIFTAMLIPYLDFYMSRPCRTGEQIAVTPLKPYRDVISGRSAETGRVPVPIPGDVSVSFLRSIGEQASASARSNIYPEYRREVANIWQEKS